MKVLYLLDSVNRGGAETLALDICRNAERCGLEMTFVATGGGDLEQEFENSGVGYHRLKRRWPIDLKLIRELRKIILEKQIEVVHGHQPVEALHLYLATVGLKNVRCVMSHHGGGLFAASRKNRLVAKYLSPLMDANISCSRALLTWLRQEIGISAAEKFHVIWNAVDESRLQPTGNSIRTELNIGESDLTMGMVANFVPSPTKDQMTICRALPQIFAEFENARFIFVGRISPGGEKNYVACVDHCAERGIADKVLFLGAREDVPDILGSLDLFVFSSLHEGLPIAVAETMLSKVPMIVSDIEPLLEATDDGTYAEMFEAQNEVELAQKTLGLLRDKVVRADLAQRAYDFARENYVIDAHIAKLLQLYESLKATAAER